MNSGKYTGGSRMFDTDIYIDKDFVSAKPLAEKLKAIPGIFGIRLNEEPEYFLIRSNGEKEIRKYSDFTLASISVPIDGNCERAQAVAYSALSNYIFGKNRLSHKISMTAVVLHEGKAQEDGSKDMTMSFILPCKYNLENTPVPLDSRIKLTQKSSHMVACRKYSGPNDEEKVQKYSSELREWLSQYSSYKVASQVQVAEYDGPSTLSFLRKYEVHIDIKGVS